MIQRRQFLTSVLAGGVVSLLSQRAESKDEPDHVSVAQKMAPNTLDTRQVANRTSLNIFENVYERLIRIDHRQNPGVMLSLAERWESTPDATSWEFTLRRGVRFHNGQSFDAEHAKYSLDQFRERIPFVKAIVKEVENWAPFSLRIVTFQPYLGLLPLLAEGPAFMVPNGFYDQGMPSKPIGTGPYMVDKYQPGEFIELRRNESYYDAKPLVRRLTFRFAIEPNSHIELLRQGEVQITDGHTNREFARFLASAQVPMAEAFAPSLLFVGLNPQDPTVMDSRVRVAMALAIDRRKIAEELQLMTRIVDFIVPPEAFAIAGLHGLLYRFS